MVTNRYTVVAKRRQSSSFLVAFRSTRQQVSLIREIYTDRRLVWYGGMCFAVLFFRLVRLTLREGSPMKNLFLAVTLLALLLLGGGDVRAQAFSPYYYDPYWDAQYQQYQQYLQWQQYLAYLQQYDPYYELHVTHYQLYLPPYPSYQPCCYTGGVIVPDWSTPISPPSRPIMNPRLRALAGPRSQAAVSPLPGAAGPLPRAAGPLPGAVSTLPQATGRR